MQIKPVFTRYLLVGALNTAFGYSVFALLVFVGLHYSIALFFATVVGIFFNFKTFGIIVFAQNERRLIWRFITVYAILYAVNVFLVFIFLPFLGNIYVANALAIILNATLGFYLNKRYVYKKN